MELKIISPQENGFVEEIKWNNEELKAEIAAKMKDYRGLVFTEESIAEAKKDRANLNKLKSAFEDERKRVKKQKRELADYELKKTWELNGYSQALVDVTDILRGESQNDEGVEDDTH